MMRTAENVSLFEIRSLESQCQMLEYYGREVSSFQTNRQTNKSANTRITVPNVGVLRSRSIFISNKQTNKQISKQTNKYTVSAHSVLALSFPVLKQQRH